jgi:hypothetical protein
MSRTWILLLAVSLAGCAGPRFHYLGLPDARTYPASRYSPDPDIRAKDYYQITEVMTVDREEYMKARKRGVKYEQAHAGHMYFCIESRVQVERVSGMKEWVTVLERRKTPIDEAEARRDLMRSNRIR